MSGPTGGWCRVARGTLDEWIRAYRRGGFEALLPAAAGGGAAHERRVARAGVRAQARAAGSDGGAGPGDHARRRRARSGAADVADPSCPRKGSTSAPTAARRGRSTAASRPRSATSCGRGMGCTARSWPGARRAGRSCWRSSMTTRRLLVGWRWGIGEDVFRLEAALRSGLMARGVPDAILVDRGSAFVSSQLLRACAVLGVKLVHASAASGHDEGQDRTVLQDRSRSVPRRDRRRRELAELNRLFSAWLEVVYHRRVHSETEQTPLARFEQAGRAGAADARAAARGVSVVAGADGDEDRDGVPCTPTATRSTRRWSVARSSWSSIRST